jgi:hypothetical protein
MLTVSDGMSDVLAAAATAFCVAPAISILDQAIVQNASGIKTIPASIKDSVTLMIQRPGKFIRSPAFLLLWGVYGGTYVAVNLATTICDKKHATDQERHLVKFFGVSSVNIALNVSKDRIFARMFGSDVPRPVPLKSIATFAARDSMTVFASFNVAPMLAESLVAAEVAGARTIAQLFCPVAMQWISAPLHLLGLNWYNQPNKGVAMSERVRFIQSEYLATALARSARIFPAFGMAPLMNAPLRQFTRSVFCDSSQIDVPLPTTKTTTTTTTTTLPRQPTTTVTR